MNVLVIALPDLQVWQLLYFDCCAESFVPRPLYYREYVHDKRQMEPPERGNRLEDWLL